MRFTQGPAIRDGDKYISLTFRIFEDSGGYAAECLELGTATCGDTFEEAHENIADAVNVHVRGLEEIGERTRYFREHGITIKTYRKPKRNVTRTVDLSVSISANKTAGWYTRELVPVRTLRKDRLAARS